MMTPADLRPFLLEKEGPNLECKEAKRSFQTKDLYKYLCALANEGGGVLVFGVTDKPPRRIVGSEAFSNAMAQVHEARQQLRPAPAVEVHEVRHPEGRVLVFEVGARPVRQPVQFDGHYWRRMGESCVPMHPDDLRAILLEDTDWTFEPLDGVTLADLDPDALLHFREGVVRRQEETDRSRYQAFTDEALLDATALMLPDGRLRRSALLLLGTEVALARHMPQAEFVFEAREHEAQIHYTRRINERRALLLTLDALWTEIRPYALASLGDVQFGNEVRRPTRYPERSVREALLNAAAHRDYTDPDSVRVRVSSSVFSVESPGPLPPGITLANIAERHAWRNRSLAEALERCGRIERSGQGVDLMIRDAVRQAQSLPVFEQPDNRRLRVTLHGTSTLAFARFTLALPPSLWEEGFTLDELRALDRVRQLAPIESLPPDAVERLLARGIVGRTKMGFLVPSLDVMPREDPARASLGSRGAKRRLAHFLRTHAPVGLSTADLEARLPVLPRTVLIALLGQMRDAGTVVMQGNTRAAKWHLKDAPDEDLEE